MLRDEHFAIALNELLTQQFDPGLFARCFALAEGDEARTKAKYIELRAQAISEAETTAMQQFTESAEREKQKQFALAELRRAEDRHRTLASQREKQKQISLAELRRLEVERRTSKRHEAKREAQRMVEKRQDP